VFVTSLSDCWISIQRRVDNSTDFYRNWTEYAAGFGEGAHTNHWLALASCGCELLSIELCLTTAGLRAVHSLTWPSGRALRMRMRLWNGTEFWADYSSFSVASEADKFRLSISGFSASHPGVGDCMAFHNGMKFSTHDKDNHASRRNCAKQFSRKLVVLGVPQTNLNGLYFYPPAALHTEEFAVGINCIKDGLIKIGRRISTALRPGETTNNSSNREAAASPSRSDRKKSMPNESTSKANSSCLGAAESTCRQAAALLEAPKSCRTPRTSSVDCSCSAKSHPSAKHVFDFPTMNQLLAFLTVALTTTSAAVILNEVHSSSWSGGRVRHFLVSSISQASDVLQCAAQAAKHLLAHQLLVFIPRDGAQQPQCIVANRSGAVCRRLTPHTHQSPCCIRVFVTSLSDCWISIQRRVDNSTDFYRNWTEYAAGFGEGAHTNHWLALASCGCELLSIELCLTTAGLRAVHSLTWPSGRALRMRMKLWNGTELWADYSSFSVASEADKFRLNVSGFHGSHPSLGDCMTWCNGMKFSTHDKDNDVSMRNCAKKFAEVGGTRRATGRIQTVCTFIHPLLCTRKSSPWESTGTFHLATTIQSRKSRCLSEWSLLDSGCLFGT
uniref:Fibrinogen C-terminal domain-containing protein n=1 Tax=Macrostomum lignano TaxID=282301 RepID=A0A1I8I3K5_9PLAT